MNMLQLWFMDEVDDDEPQRGLIDLFRSIEDLPSQFHYHPYTGDKYQAHPNLHSSVLTGLLLGTRERKSMGVRTLDYRDRLLREICSTAIPSPWRCHIHGRKPSGLWGSTLYSKNVPKVGWSAPVSTLCGLCVLHSVDEPSTLALGGDVHFSWEIPDTGVELIVRTAMQEFYITRRAGRWKTKFTIGMELGLICHD